MNEIETLQNRIKELEAENEQLKKDLEHARSYKHTIKMRNRNLQVENERLKGELEMEHDDCSNAKKCEVEYHKAYEKELDENVILRKENAKLKCLALHLFSNYFFDCYWNSKGLDPNRYLHLHEKYEDAYRKAKKELK